MAYSPIINVMTDAAIKASRGLLHDFGEVSELQVSKKGPANFVTKSDERSEQVLIRELNKARPGYRFLVEESGEIDGKNDEFRWIIDPLDGTHNFIHAVPYFCISIALEKTFHSGRKAIVAAVVYDPIHNDMYTAEIGEGALLNGNRKLSVSKRHHFEESMLVISSPHSKCEPPFNGTKLMTAAISTHASLRHMGASALDLAGVASGRFDAACLVQQKKWDVAAGWLLITEAGGLVTDIHGEDYDLDKNTVLASNQELHKPMLKLLAQVAGS